MHQASNLSSWNKQLAAFPSIHRGTAVHATQINGKGLASQ
jgi:hypothetical protein